MGQIYPNLEKGLQEILNKYSKCVTTGYSAFRPGYSLANEIIRCIEASSAVVFLSQIHFVENYGVETKHLLLNTKTNQ